MIDVALPVGLATGIGSLPHADVDEAIAFVLEHQPRLPAAPSLPRRAGAEGMIAQAAWGITGVSVLPDGSLLVDEGVVDPGQPLTDLGVGGEPFVGLRAFLAAMSGRTTPIKLQITGPVTLGIALHACGVDARKAFAVAANAVERAPARCSPWPAPRPRTPRSSCSSTSRGSPPRSTPVSRCGWATRSTRCRGPWRSSSGGRSPASTAAAGPTGRRCSTRVQVVSVPVGMGATEHTSAFVNYVEGGGWVAWGAVPTDQPLGESADILWRRLRAEWDVLIDSGIDPAQLVEQSMVTPACGLATLALPYARRVVDLTADLARRLEAQAVQLGIDLGA